MCERVRQAQQGLVLALEQQHKSASLNVNLMTAILLDAAFREL